MTYTQVVLTKPLGEGAYATRSAWIPSRFAKVGKVLRIASEEGWTVAVAGSHPMPEDFVHQRRDDWRYQRRVSDV